MKYLSNIFQGIFIGIGIVIIFGILYLGIKARDSVNTTTETEPDKLYVS